MHTEITKLCQRLAPTLGLCLISSVAVVPPTVAAEPAGMQNPLGLPGGAPVPPTHHWPMEPWTDQVTTLDGDTVQTPEGNLVDFPGDGSEWVRSVHGRGLHLDATDLSDDWGWFAEFTLSSSEGTIAHWLRPSTDIGEHVVLYASDYTGQVSPDYNGFGAAGDAFEVHTGTLAGEYFALWQDGDGPANQPGTGSRRVQGGVVAPDRWTHLAMTWSVAGDLVLYVNCVAVDTVSMSDGVFSGHTPFDFLLGRPSQPANRYWRGAIDEVKIFDIELTPVEVQQEFCSKRQYDDGLLFAPSSAELDKFGSAVAVDGEWLMVGATGRDEVFWYRQNTEGGLDLVTSRTGANHFGQQVDLDGATAVVGTPYLGANVFGKDVGGTNNWGQLTQLEPDPDDESGAFGRSVRLSGDLLLVSSPIELIRPAPGSSTGGGSSFYLFGRDIGGANNWGKMLRREGLALIHGARAVAIDGDLLAATTSETEVKIFERNQGGPDAWGEVGTIFLTGVNSLDLFEDRLILGVPDENGGSAFIYGRNAGGPNSWAIEQNLAASDKDRDDRFGAAVRFASESQAVVSAPGDFNRHDHSTLYVFRRNGATWYQERRLLAGTFDLPYETSPTMGSKAALAAGPEVVVAGATNIGQTILGPGSLPDSGQVHIFRTPFFADGFESGDLEAWNP